jgi:4,5-DOPA dioxygenase extradiol
MDMPRTIHDFGGFPRLCLMYSILLPEILNWQKKQQNLAPVVVEEDHNWGLDHGAWSVIKHMYPNADIPVIQMSIDYTKPPQYHFDLAKDSINFVKKEF